MAEGATDPLEVNGFEECNALEAITDMILDRASALGNNSGTFNRLYFELIPTQIDKLQYIRRAVYDLAPSFVNMDYPYWDYCWSKFPQFYSQDVISRDEEHNLNILPTNFCSFDNDSVAVYKKFLRNVVYWLKKYRYARAKTSWRTKQFNLRCAYDKQFFYFRNGVPVYTWGSYYYDQDGHSVYVEDDSFTPADVWQYATGYVYRDTPSISNDGSFSVTVWDYHNLNKAYTSPGRWDDLPLQNMDPWRQNCGREMNYVPEDLITKNPSGFQAEVLWFVVPNTSNYTKEKNEYVVTQVEQSQYHTWGSQSQFGAWSYNATEGTIEKDEYQIRRGEYKETEYELRDTDSTRKRVTNWSDDGTRSVVISDTTEPSSHYYPSSQESRDIDQFDFPFRTLVPFGANSRPCFSAGVALPHGEVTYHVCDQSSLLLPSWNMPTPQYLDTNYCWGIDEWASNDYHGNTKWVPIFDFGDFVIPEPEEPGE